MARVASMPNIIETWGSTAEERAASYPCERHIEAPTSTLYRAVDVDAPVHLTYREQALLTYLVRNQGVIHDRR